MAALADLSPLLDALDYRIQTCSFTKSDGQYHKTKQSLHNMWAKVYASEKKVDKVAFTDRIVGCLSDLEKKTAENELKKYQQYYDIRPAPRVA